MSGSKAVDAVDDELDELGLMWQSRPVRRAGETHLAPALAMVGSATTSSAGSRPDRPSATRSGHLSLERLEAEICSLAGRIAASCCRWLRLIAEFDDRKGWAQWGLKSCAHWLAWACSVAPPGAREYVRVARVLRDVPLIEEAFAAGRLSYSKVRAVTRVVGRVDEQTLLDQALVHTAAQLERVVRGYRQATGAGLDQQRHRRAGWYWDEDGMFVLRARLPPDEGAILLAALQSAEHSLGVPAGDVADQGCDRGIAAPPGADVLDIDPHQVSAADALVALAQRGLAAGEVDSSGDDRHLVVLHLDSRLFATQDAPGESAGDAASGPVSDQPDAQLLCRLENGPGVERSTAERLACDAAMMAVAQTSLGSQGEELSLGRKTRKISVPLRRMLRIRDGGCRYPGCHRIRHLQAHHVVHWANGGSTDPANLVLLCRFHHMLLHEGGFTLSFAPDSRGHVPHWIFRRPDKVVVPDHRALDPGPPTTEYFSADPPDDAGLIRPGWRGERFSLAESVGVWCRAPGQSELATREAS